MMQYLRSLAAFSAFFLASPALLHADTILLGSYGTDAANPGVANTALSYDPTDSTVNTKSNLTYDISGGTNWHASLPDSSYISFDPGTAPGGDLIAPNGTYIYTTSFDLTAAEAGGSGSMTVLADDTVAVYLNGQLVLAAAVPMGPTNTYAHCSDTGPNCLTPFTFALTGLVAGTNDLTFDVQQVNGASEGLDFSGIIAIAPEPATLSLFGIGAVGLGFVIRRRSSQALPA